MILMYLLKVTVCIALLFGAYQLLFAKLTFFKFNRAYLLFALIFSFAIPAITIENRHEVIVNKNQTELKVAYSNDGSFEKDSLENNSASINFANWNQLAEYIYYAVLFMLLFKKLLTVVYIQYLINKSRLLKQGSVIFVTKDAKIKNCSFINQIIVDSSLSKAEQNLIIQHEQLHVNQVHSFDKLLINIATCILWFNPLIYMWRLAMDDNHEFLADEATSAKNDKKTYASLLLQLASPVNNFYTNNFSKLPLKKRIMMIYKKPNTPIKKLTYLAIIPILSFCCMAFINQKDVVIEKEHVNVVIKQKQSTSAQNNPDNVLDMVKPASNLKTDHPVIIHEEQNLLGEVAAVKSLFNDSINRLSINPQLKKLHSGRELILVVDAGHGGKDGAAEGVGGVKEKDLNLRAAQILKEEADKRNIKVILTRSEDKMIPLKLRLPAESGTAFISIHHNSMPKPNIKSEFEGIEVFVSKSNPNIKMAEQFGISLLGFLKQLQGIEVRDSLKNANLLLTRESKIPAVIIELGNISSEASLAYVRDEKNLRRISNLILDGFVAFSKS